MNACLSLISSSHPRSIVSNNNTHSVREREGVWESSKGWIAKKVRRAAYGYSKLMTRSLTLSRVFFCPLLLANKQLSLAQTRWLLLPLSREDAPMASCSTLKKKMKNKEPWRIFTRVAARGKLDDALFFFFKLSGRERKQKRLFM